MGTCRRGGGREHTSLLVGVLAALLADDLDCSSMLLVGLRSPAYLVGGTPSAMVSLVGAQLSPTARLTAGLFRSPSSAA